MIFEPKHTKPTRGSACNGCGYCCAVDPCKIGVEFLSSPANKPCVALEFDPVAGSSSCGMVTRPIYHLYKAIKGHSTDFDADKNHHKNASISEKVVQSLGINWGCDSDDDSQSIQWPWIVDINPDNIKPSNS